MYLNNVKNGYTINMEQTVFLTFAGRDKIASYLTKIVL